MKKTIILPAIGLLTLLGVFALGQQSKPANAAVQQTVAQSNIQQNKVSSSLTGEKSGTDKSNPEIKGAESDGSGGHQDAQGSNTDHQFNGEE